MSLNFSFANVHAFEAVTTSPFDPEMWHPIANGLVWLSMICGYREITSKNHNEVAQRIMAYQIVTGPYLRNIYITRIDVERFVGMTTNASTMTAAQWAKKLGEIAMDEARNKSPQARSGLDMVSELAAAKAAA